MISYYELLGMIKDGKAPNKIRVHLTSEPRIYEAEYDGGDFSYYWLSKNSVEDREYKCYLAECFLESSMFDKNIEILDEKILDKKKLERLEFVINDEEAKIEIEIITKINEIIHYLNSKGE